MNLIYINQKCVGSNIIFTYKEKILYICFSTKGSFNLKK